MREILFGGKRTDNGQWAEGHYFKNGNGTFIFTFPYHANHAGIDVMVKVDPETVCQYTGFSDKNKKNIFENHIVKSDDGKIGQVQWFEEHGAFMIWNVTDNIVNFLYDNDFSKIEVIGNIFDNPELLESKEAAE